ncbi:MAG: hypothetical protein ACI4RQ_03130 [Methanobrevibacter wolinii]|uniref:hypothetical protein n=1 Tax=Methanobrevibacter wolinii TaxID=190977 RepID=UPI0005B2E739|nr:hypothetical protein [Methanobrevibacter wolinii]MDD5960046.1 hypothetical protein [Methanobrevibacter wolinii]
MRKLKWEVKFGIILIILIFIIYGIDYIIFGDFHDIFHYVMLHLGFIPIDILIVTLVIDKVMDNHEQKTLQEKIDILMGSFFSGIGNGLISMFYYANGEVNITKELKSIETWKEKDYENVLNELDENPISFNFKLSSEDRTKFFIELKEYLNERRPYLFDLIENPTLHQTDNFSELLLAMMHLTDELSYRKTFENLPESDYTHLSYDISRVYSKLIYEWIRYLEYTYKNYPYMLKLAVRINPFNENASIYVKE